ncbi:hypothetical protein L7F22_006939 [Adiantum nelumboides]|nr:hypothetical protein [Adiantum nelumboides]
MNMAQLMENAEVADDLIQGKPDEDGFRTRRKEPQGKQFSAKGNVTSRLTILNWKKPECPHFETEFYGPLRLNPGVAAIIGLMFKPLKALEYASELHFTATKESFSVALKGLCSVGHVQCQAVLNFGSHAVSSTTQKLFQFSNSGSEATSFEWIVEPPFSIFPKTGQIKPGESVLATCHFSPERAQLYSAQATCIVLENFPTTMNVNGTGRYTSFHINPSILDFGDVVVGSAKQLTFSILNTSNVVAKICLDLVEDCIHPSSAVFKLDLIEASILPNEQLSVKVLYSPLSAGSFSAGQIVVTSSSQYGGSLTCTGYALRPSVSISTTAIDFGSLPLGSSISNSLSLSNMSKVHVSFQFMVSAPSVFKIHPDKGVIKPKSNLSVCIEFRPREARNFYNRVFCIVQDQHLHHCDFVGSCFLDKVNFPTLQLPHITKQRTSTVHGFQSASFAGVHENSFCEASSSMPICAYENSSDFCTSISGGSTVGDHNINSPILWSVDHICEGAFIVEDLWEEYFLGRSRQLDFVEISPLTLNFNDTSHVQKAEKQEVVVRNFSETTIFCLWQTAEISGLQEEHSSTTQVVQNKGPWMKEKLIEVFQVSPQEATLSPQSSMTFHVTFTPNKKSQFFVEMLDLCIYKNTHDSHVTVPYQASIQVSGNSFNSDQQKYLPQAYCFPSEVVFPPALQGSCVYQTLALRNQGCTPIRFSFDTSNLSSLFSVKPSQGVVEEKSFQLIAIRFEAGNSSSHVAKLPCILNDNSNEKILLTLIARSDNPKVELEEGNLIQFKPANVGVPSERTITLRNISSIPAVFKWIIPRETADVFIFKQPSGIILGNQQIKVDCCFCPTSSKGFKADMACLTSAVIEKSTCNGKHGVSAARFCGPEMSKIVAVFQGEGREGSLKIEPETLELGTILVGFPQRHKLIIRNLSEGCVKYMLSFSSIKGMNNAEYKLKFDNSQGSIPSHSSREVTITFKPLVFSRFAVLISCNIISSMDLEGGRAEGMPQCILSAEALFPSLSICGARGEGFSQAQTWRKLYLDTFESLLAETETKQDVGLKGCQDLFGLGGTFGERWKSSFNFCFGRGHMASKPTVFILVLTIRNNLPVSWKIRLWNDKDVDLENWVEEPEPINEKEHIYMNVREQGLIRVFPREGHLNPGEKVQIKFIYRHYLEGVHFFPAILEIKNGCALPIMFSGETLCSNFNSVSLETETFMLKSIEVGHVNPPLQTFELRNDGNSEVNYEVDLGPLRGLQQENYGFEVLACLNPFGSIPPHETLLLNWRFQPIERKSYTVDVFISVENGEGVMLPIQGAGIDKGVLRSTDQASEEKLETLLTCCEWGGLPAMLTIEHLTFENVQALSSVERLVAVKNVSADSRVTFSWHCSYAADNCVYGHFSVIPSQGIIDCGATCLCKMTFTAGIQPQYFETTLYCHIQEVIPEHVNTQVQSQAAGDAECNDELYVQDWNRLGSRARVNIGEEHREHTSSSLTCSTNLRLPRLSAKGPLRFSTSATLKPLTDDEQGTRLEQIKKNKGVLYLTVSGSIYSREIMQKGPTMLDYFQESKDSDDVTGQLLARVLGEAMQEIVDAQVVESRLQNTKATFFEQFGKRMNDLPSANESRTAAIGTCCNSVGNDASLIDRLPQPEMSVEVFDLTEMMLEFMLFEIVKQFHDSDLNSLFWSL